ncbi:putative pectinesterase 29 [Quercus suber]|uniref:pectinesterase n=1 Tax=Quercus suber TaxID=58331 RepID=A0AAW0LII4_QUESU
MQFLIFIFYFTVTLFLFLNVSNAKGTNAKSILVDQSGKGHFKTVQEAIDSIPSNNKWTIIDLNPGTYKEKVKIPKKNRTFILRGKSRDTTVIEYVIMGTPWKVLPSSYLLKILWLVVSHSRLGNSKTFILGYHKYLIKEN